MPLTTTQQWIQVICNIGMALLFLSSCWVLWGHYRCKLGGHKRLLLLSMVFAVQQALTRLWWAWDLYHQNYHHIEWSVVTAFTVLCMLVYEFVTTKSNQRDTLERSERKDRELTGESKSLAHAGEKLRRESEYIRDNMQEKYVARVRKRTA